MKTLIRTLCFLTLGVIAVGCSKTMEDYPLSNLRAISGFAIDFYHNAEANIHMRHEGTIDETNRTITLNLPTDVDLTRLRPTISLSPWSTVYPKTLEEVDISAGQLDYTVTAQSGKTAVYTVYVTTDYIYQGAELWQLHLLDLLDEYGDPLMGGPESYNDGAKLTMVIPKGTDKTALRTHLDLSQASHRATIEVSDSGDENSFRKFADEEAINYENEPVVFRITAENGKVVRYYVSLTYEEQEGL